MIGDSSLVRPRQEPRSTRNSVVLLVIAVIVHLVAIARQVDDGGVSLLERVVTSAFAPLQIAAARSWDRGRDILNLWPDLRAVTMENQQLKQELRLAQLRLLEQRPAVEENARLRSVLDLSPRLPTATLVADVVARDASPWFRSLTIDKGRGAGIDPGSTVLTPSGVLGRVISVSERTSQVQLLVDEGSGVAAVTERARIDGVVSGRGAEEGTQGILLMKYVPSLADVKEGDIVVTSGLDGLFQKGLVVGMVRRVDAAAGLFKDVWVQPSASPGLAEQVFVTLRRDAPTLGTPTPVTAGERSR